MNGKTRMLRLTFACMASFDVNAYPWVDWAN